jgi:hypothetical protein
MSHHRNPKQAGLEAAKKALEKAGIDKPDFVFAFASVGYNQPILLKAIREATNGANLIGCSGEGIIADGEADESNFSVAVMVIRSDEIHFTSGLTTGLKENPAGVGETIAKSIQPHLQSNPLALFVLADGLTLNFDRFVAGLEKELNLDKQLPLLGGTAADNWEFKRTYQYCNDEVVSDGVAWALLSGQARIAWAVNHGCIPIGVKRQVTRCQGNVIYEIDNQPVLDVIKEYLVGDEIHNWQEAVINLCLGFAAPSDMKDYDEFLIRFIPSKDDASGSLTIQTEVTEGTDIWMTRRDQEKITEGINRLASTINEQIGDNPAKLVFQFDCCGRGKVVFREQQKTELLQILQKQVAPNAPWIGFFTLGEIGPVGDRNCFHNYTAVLTAIY